MKPRSLSARPRILAISLPFWRTDRLKRAKPSLEKASRPLVTFEKTQNALRIAATDARAGALGLYPGQALSEARAMVPELMIEGARHDADHAAFLNLCKWLTRYSPWASMENVGDAFIDITGGAHLFGGEDGVIEDVCGNLHDFGYEAHAAIAETPGAAWALARFGTLAICPPGETKEALAALPVDALRLPPETTERLKRLGFQVIGQLYDVPRPPLCARFGDLLLKRLDQALGQAPEAISPFLPAPQYRADMRLPEPIAREQDVLICLEHLATRLETALQEDGKGARELEALLFRVDGVVAKLTVRTSRPAQAPAHIVRLFKNKLEDARIEDDAGFGFDCVRLSAFACERIGHMQDDALAAGEASEASSELLDRLSNRLGAERVLRIRLTDSHIPERAACFEPVTRANGQSSPASSPLDALRPIKLLTRPEPIEAIAEIPDGPPMQFIWRRVSYKVTRASGPERVEAEWRCMSDDQAPRDYYRIEDEVGRRYWIFRKSLYERGAATPSWYMHGFFA